MSAADAGHADDEDTVVIERSLAYRIVENLEGLTNAVKELTTESRSANAQFQRAIVVQEVYQDMAKTAFAMVARALEHRLVQVGLGVAFAVLILKLGGDEARWAITFSCELALSPWGIACPKLP